MADSIYTFFTYFYSVRDIKDFKPFERYNGKDKWDYIEQHKPLNSVIRWLSDNINNISTVRKIKGVEFYAVDVESANASYTRYCKFERINRFNIVNWDDEIIEKLKLGKSHKTNGKRYIIINKETFDKQYKPAQEDTPFDEEEEFDIEAWIDESKDELDGFYYIMTKFIPKEHKQSIISTLEASGWEYKDKLFSRKLRRAGYRLKIEE